MKKLFLFILLISVTIPTFGQYSLGRPVLTRTKHEKKTMRHFNSLKRHKKHVSFGKRAGISHPSVNKNTRKMLRGKRYD